MQGKPRSDPWEALRELPMGQRVEISDEAGHVWTGTVVPRQEMSGERVLPLKLESGYNVGIRIGPHYSYRVLDAPRHPLEALSASRPEADPGAPFVTLLTTGGTIASRIDYTTGGVKPVDEESELLAFYPDLEMSGRVRVVPVFDRLSEDLEPPDFETLAGKVVEAFGQGARGVVIAHGTDVLGFTSAALSFLLADLPGPVVLVGSQRSPDRPSSDGTSNLRTAVHVAFDRRIGEVVVVMHAGLSDTRFAIHRGTWVRKMHSSRRDAFESRNGAPIGTCDDGRILLDARVRPPRTGPVRLDGTLDARAGLLWFYPGLSPERAASFVEGLRGVVLAGTGLGHVAARHLGWIRTAVDRGVVVTMTTQCLAGNADPFVYSTGRELRRAGVVYLEDLLPETAYAKMMWALGQTSDRGKVVELLLADRAGEFQRRHLARGDAA
jgi:glutamyl-tRNA(Gln) amidotransferase subunit D